MGIRRVTRKFLRFLIPTLIVLAILQYSLGEFSQTNDSPYENTRLRCIINLDSTETMKTGYLTGYNYDLLQRFASDNSAGISISMAEPETDYLDSLLCDSVDIVIAPNSWKHNETLQAVSMTDSTGTWFIKSDRRKLRTLNMWMGSFIRMDGYFNFYNRFFACYNPYRKGRAKDILTPYDDLLKKYSAETGWDWKLMASVMWNESKFKIQVKSRRGAVGLMQIMPNTAASFGVYDLLNPEENIRCGAMLLASLQNSLKGYGFNEDDLTRFTLAAYNAGLANIQNSIETIRRKKGRCSSWNDFSDYFQAERDDSLRFKGQETIAYINVVFERYGIFTGKTPKKPCKGDRARN